jgi:hypothetical protein
LGVTSLGPAEEEDVGLGAMELVVDPSSRLLHTESSPFLCYEVRYGFGEKSIAGNLLVDLLGEEDMAILIVIVHVLVGVLDLIGVVGHSNFNEVL